MIESDNNNTFGIGSIVKSFSGINLPGTWNKMYNPGLLSINNYSELFSILGFGYTRSDNFSVNKSTTSSQFLATSRLILFDAAWSEDGSIFAGMYQSTSSGAARLVTNKTSIINSGYATYMTGYNGSMITPRIGFIGNTPYCIYLHSGGYIYGWNMLTSTRVIYQSYSDYSKTVNYAYGFVKDSIFYYIIKRTDGIDVCSYDGSNFSTAFYSSSLFSGFNSDSATFAFGDYIYFYFSGNVLKRIPIQRTVGSVSNETNSTIISFAQTLLDYSTSSVSVNYSRTKAVYSRYNTYNNSYVLENNNGTYSLVHYGSSNVVSTSSNVSQLISFILLYGKLMPIFRSNDSAAFDIGCIVNGCAVYSKTLSNNLITSLFSFPYISNAGKYTMSENADFFSYWDYTNSNQAVPTILTFSNFQIPVENYYSYMRVL